MKIGRTTYKMSRPRTKTEEQKRQANVKRNMAYNKAHTIRLPINLNTNTDRDILDFLTTIPNKQGYIKDLVRSDMAARELLHDLPADDMAARELLHDLPADDMAARGLLHDLPTDDMAARELISDQQNTEK